MHPVGEADGLLRNNVSEVAHAGLARLHKAVDSVGLDVLLGVEPHLLLHLNLHPKTLAVEPVLVPLFEALHGLVALEQVLVGAAPGVVDTHRVVGGYGAVDKGPSPVRVLVAVQVLLHHPGLVPPRLDIALHLREVHPAGDGLEQGLRFFLVCCHASFCSLFGGSCHAEPNLGSGKVTEEFAATPIPCLARLQRLPGRVARNGRQNVGVRGAKGPVLLLLDANGAVRAVAGEEQGVVR